MADQRLRSVPLFAALPDEDLDRIDAATTLLRVAAGDRLFDEGDAATAAYVIVEGDLEIRKRSTDREILLAVRGAGDVIGEMSLLEDAPRMAAAEARSDTTLLEIPKAVFDDVLSTSPAAARSLFTVLLARWRETESRLRQREQLAHLGTLSAGLAHELNNPAAAAKRAVAGFAAAAERLADSTAALQRHPANEVAVGIIERLVRSGPQRLGTIARGDREEELTATLEALGVTGAAGVAAFLVDSDTIEVDRALADAQALGDRDLATVTLQVAAAQQEVSSLSAVAMAAATRISEIVGAVKSYAFTGQAPVQEVDLAQMLDDTLVLMAHKLGDIEIVRDYEQVPPLEAYGSELNQVWTNLVDNAADAIASAGRTPGRIVLRTRLDGDMAVVEVEDDGPGIAEEILPLVFNSFFTTKPPGSGTGLGLDISRGIVVHRHGGEIGIDSEPGRTTVRVRLPTSGVPGTA